MSTTTGNEYALSKGNDFPYRISLTTPNATTGKYEAATGLSISAFLATEKGGTAIVDTTLPLAEYSGVGAGSYAATLDATVVDVVIANRTALWAAFKITNDLLVWYKVPVITDRVAS